MVQGTIVRERTQLTGMQPIHKACMYGQKAAVEQLKELGADIRCTTNWGSTCLHWTVKGYVYHKGDHTAGRNYFPKHDKKEYIAIAQLLLKNAPRLLFKQDHKGRDPLKLAKEISASDIDPKLDMIVFLEERCKQAELQKIEMQKDAEKKRPKVRKLPV